MIICTSARKVLKEKVKWISCIQYTVTLLWWDAVEKINPQWPSFQTRTSGLFIQQPISGLGNLKSLPVVLLKRDTFDRPSQHWSLVSKFISFRTAPLQQSEQYLWTILSSSTKHFTVGLQMACGEQCSHYYAGFTRLFIKCCVEKGQCLGVCQNASKSLKLLDDVKQMLCTHDISDLRIQTDFLLR